MFILLYHKMAGDHGQYEPGDVVDLPDHVAEQILRAHQGIKAELDLPAELVREIETMGDEPPAEPGDSTPAPRVPKPRKPKPARTAPGDPDQEWTSDE